MSVFQELRRRLADILSFGDDLAPEKETIARIEESVDFRGAKLWVLVLAIFVASLGLNTNSAAVIIGAMLISPLMGPIIGMGLGIGINDFMLFKRAAKNYLVATLFSVATATVYFLLTPLDEVQSELLARTSPTIYDVGIALCGGLAGAFFAYLHAIASVKLGADQTISGTAINMLAPGVAVMICRTIFGSTDTIPLALAAKIPMVFTETFDTTTKLGMFLKNVFCNYTTTFLAFIAVAVVWFVFYKTRFGLRMRACGENPQAAASLGINVFKMRYAGTTISGALAGMGGFVYSLTTANCTANGDVAGFGFLALAVMIFGNWNPLNTALAALLFGLCKCIAAAYSTIDINGDGVYLLREIGINSNIYRMLPFLITLVVLTFSSGKSRAPKAEGIPYDKGAR